MKKNIIAALMLAFIFTGVSAQNSTGGSTSAMPKKDTRKNATKSGKVENTFIDRYYQMKDSYKELSDAYGPYAASKHSLDEFTKRYFSFKDGYPALAEYAADYAASKHDLKTFEKRYYEVKDASAELSAVRGDYAASNNVLLDFTSRYHEIKAAYPQLDQKAYGAYAGSNQRLNEFIKRYNEIKDSYALESGAHSSYAATDKKLEKGKSRDKDDKGPNMDKTKNKDKGTDNK